MIIKEPYLPDYIFLAGYVCFGQQGFNVNIRFLILCNDSLTVYTF